MKWKGMQSLKVIRNKAVYQAGRISTYVIIGLLFYALGRSFALENLQKTLSLTVGVLLLMWLVVTIMGNRWLNGKLLQLFHLISSRLRPLLTIKGAISSYILGFVNGLLPCGLVYVAAFSSVVQENPVDNVKYMLLFGMGTLPLLVSVMMGASFLHRFLAPSLTKLTPLVIGALAILFILRGLELNIPYVSPVINEVNDTTVQCVPQ